MHISYLPPKGYPDQLSITLMDGRSVRLEMGRHSYEPDVVARLSDTVKINSALQNLIAQQIIRIERPTAPQELIPLFDGQGNFMGHFPVQQEIKNEYATHVNTPPEAVAPPMQAVMSTIPGYYPIAGTVPGVTGAPEYAPAIDGLNQYTVNGKQQPIQNNQVNTVIPIDSSADIFNYQKPVMTPTGNISAIRANGQVLPEEINSMPSTPNQAGRPSPFPQPQQQPQPQQFIQQQPVQNVQNQVEPVQNVKNQVAPVVETFDSIETESAVTETEAPITVKKTTKKRRAV